MPDERTPEEMKTVGVAFAQMFPGLSNFMKAQYVLAHQRAIGATGKTTDLVS